ncbi:hypothetical protein ABER23_14760 [Paenibacillus lautus]
MLRKSHFTKYFAVTYDTVQLNGAIGEKTTIDDRNSSMVVRVTCLLVY